MKTQHDKVLSRRQYLKGAVKLSTAAVALPAIIPSSALGLAGTTAPSNRITLGCIGTGLRADGAMNHFKSRLGDAVEINAFCDPNDQVRQAVVMRRASDPATAFQTRDFRELLARDDVDAVFIGSPDHWHAIQSIAAARAGKHVYCEKPLSNTIAEGRALVDAIHRHNVVFQHGTFLRQMEGARRACEMVRNGVIGELKSVKVGCPGGHQLDYPDSEPVPDWLDWDMWQGPALEAPYHSTVIGGFPGHHLLRGWYFIRNYSRAGWVSGFGVHDIDLVHWGMGMDNSGPVEIEGQGNFPSDGLFDTVMTFELQFRYANGVTVTMTDTGRNRHGVTFEGTLGTVFTRSRVESNPAHLARYQPGPNDIRLYNTNDVQVNFIECIRSRRPTILPAETAHRATTTCLLGGIALELGRKLRWDPQQEQFVNDPQANRYLSYAMRSPWRL